MKEDPELISARDRLRWVLLQERPERRAGGFARDDGTVAFWLRVNALLSPDQTVLDFGAGRGRQFDIPDAGFCEALQKLQGKVTKVIGTDVHEGIYDHPYLDERHVVSIGKSLPLADASIDIVVADWVVEHLEDPALFSVEMERILKPNGWICARTVNRWGYVGLGARILPMASHERIVGKLIPVAKADDVFPKHYKLNTLTDIKRWFHPQKWSHSSYLDNTIPRYFGKSRALFRFTEIYQKLAPRQLATDLFIFLQKRGDTHTEAPPPSTEQIKQTVRNGTGW